jgi:hypothetical protein
VRILQSIALVTVALAALVVQASQSEFARGRILDTSDGSVVQRVTVPDDVYEWVVRRDLGDVRVFNRNQEEVPYNVRRPAGREEYSAWVSLPLYPVREEEAAGTADLGIRVELSESGAIIAYQGSSIPTDQAKAYLLDATALRQIPTEMKLEWVAGVEGESISRIRLETSDDLNSWQTLIAETTIARLSNASGEVLLDRFDLPRRKARYLRITQINGNLPLQISQVDVRHRSSALPKRRWRTLAGTPVAEGWEFASGGWFPIDRLQLTSSGNFLVTAHVYSRVNEDDPWRDRGFRTFYLSSVAAVVAESEPLRINDGDRFWRVEFEGEGLTDPALRVGWLPDEVVFLRQGSAPYVLAYGQVDIEGRQWPLTELLRKLNGSRPLDLADVPFARALDAQLLGGPARLVAEPEPIDWRTIVLWTVLLLGVGAVGAMAYRLLRS